MNTLMMFNGNDCSTGMASDDEDVYGIDDSACNSCTLGNEENIDGKDDSTGTLDHLIMILC